MVSGELLAKRLKVSRVAIWKQVQALAGMGFPIESAERRGYRFSVTPDPSLMDWRPAKGSWTIPHYFLTTRSTQTLAKEGGVSGLPEGHLWIAEMQSKGRGRLERVWESPYGGLWFSLLLRPSLPAPRIPPLTLLAGLCLREAIEKTCGVQARLKWPNDLLVQGKKLAGVLTDMSGQIDRTEWVVLGIGVNVHNTVPRSLRGRAISVAELTGKRSKRAALLAAFLDEFRPAYRRFQKEGFGPFQARYWSHYDAPRQPVTLQTTDGQVRGVAIGVNASGALLIESRDKIRAFSEGEIQGGQSLVARR